MKNVVLKLAMVGGALVNIAGVAHDLPLPPKVQPYVAVLGGIGAILAGLAHPAPAQS